MAEIKDLEVVDANNGTRVDALWPESMPMRNVNDGGRSEEGIIARWEKDTNGSIVSTGTSSQYTIPSNRDLSQGVYDGLELMFRPHVKNATGATILTTVSPGLEQPVAIVDTRGNPIPGDVFQVGVAVRVVYDSVGSRWVTVSGTGAGLPAHFGCVYNGTTDSLDSTYNVTSLAKQTTGIHRLTLTNALSDNTPLIAVNVIQTVGSSAGSYGSAIAASTTNIDIRTYNTSGALTDCERVTVVGHNLA